MTGEAFFPERRKPLSEAAPASWVLAAQTYLCAGTPSIWAGAEPEVDGGVSQVGPPSDVLRLSRGAIEPNGPLDGGPSTSASVGARRRSATSVSRTGSPLAGKSRRATSWRLVGAGRCGVRRANPGPGRTARNARSRRSRRGR